MIPVIEQNIQVEKIDLIKIFLYISLLKRGLIEKFSDRELSIISNLYCKNGTSSKEDLNLFIDNCYNLGLGKKGSENSIRNVFSKGRNLGILKRDKANKWNLQEEYLPKYNSNILVLKYLLTNYDKD